MSTFHHFEDLCSTIDIFSTAVQHKDDQNPLKVVVNAKKDRNKVVVSLHLHIFYLRHQQLNRQSGKLAWPTISSCWLFKDRTKNFHKGWVKRMMKIEAAKEYFSSLKCVLKRRHSNSKYLFLVVLGSGLLLSKRDENKNCIHILFSQCERYKNKNHLYSTS